MTGAKSYCTAAINLFFKKSIGMRASTPNDDHQQRRRFNLTKKKKAPQKLLNFGEKY